MNRIKLTCEVITPMFMAGADGKTPELRPSEFKGMMRFWWRAAKAEDDIDKLKKEEAKIFGGTAENEGKSKITIKTKYEEDVFMKYKNKKNLKDEYNFNWNYDKIKKCLQGKDTGIGYLFYSTVLPNKERDFIKDGFNFEIEISSYDENAFKQALASLWLSIYLGGFGTRARRGGGNISVSLIDGNNIGIDFVPKGDNFEKVSQWITENSKKAFQLINKEKVKNFAHSYSNLSFSRFILSKKSSNSWKEALNDIGKIFKEFREKNSFNIFDSAIFGLPIVHRRRNLKVVAKRTDRRASPIIFKIIKSESKFYWMVLRLSGEFLRKGDVIKADDKTQAPNYRLIDEFWNNLKNMGKQHILNTPQILDKIVDKLKASNPSRIILFGAKARGDAHKESDIDIAVESTNPIPDIFAPVDIINLQKTDNNLKEKIKREGVIIYERKS